MTGRAAVERTAALSEAITARDLKPDFRVLAKV